MSRSERQISNRLRVAHITTIDMSLHDLLLNQLRSLRQAGYEVVGISTAGPHVNAITAAGIRHIPVTISRNVSPLQDLMSLWRLYRVLRQGGYTIVHTHTPKADLLGQLAARLAGVPIVVNTVHGYYFHEHMSPPKRRFFVTLEKIAVQRSDLVLSQNQEDIQTAIRERICSPDKIKYLGNGIDLSTFDPTRFPAETIAQKRMTLGLPDNALVVGFVGRLAARRKGFLDFLAAGRSIVQQNPKVRFLIVGEPDETKKDAVQPEIACDYGIAENCLFLGRRSSEELPSLYALMNVLVLPSLFEGMPRVAMEAAAMGIPVVASDVRGNRETVEHGRNGLLVPFGDVEALRQAIHDILDNPVEARRMGAEGRRMALERFDERIVFEKVKTEYARLLEEKGLPLPPSTQAAVRDC